MGERDLQEETEETEKLTGKCGTEIFFGLFFWI
jgi:hypothetical protein